MKRRLLLIASLLTVTLIVDCCLVFASEWAESRGSRSFYAWFSLVEGFFAQAILLAVWAGLARRPSFPWRLSAMVAGITVISAIECFDANVLLDGDNFRTHVIVGTAYVSHVLLAFLALRIVGVRLTHLTEDHPLADSIPNPERLQYSLANLLGWITGVAVLLSIVRSVSQFGRQWGTFLELWRWEVPLLISLVAIALSAAWTALGNSWTIFRILLLGLVILAVAFAHN